jgi:hypothetical protein
MAVLRDLSIILVAVEIFVVGLMPVVLLGALIYGTGWLRRHENLPSWLKIAQAYVALGQGYVQLAMAAIARPFIVVNGALATVREWVTGIANSGGDEQ